MMVPDRLRLPLVFDASALGQELTSLADDEWIPHFNQAIYRGDWSGVALRSAAGAGLQLYPDPTAENFTDQAIVASFPHLRAALDSIRCPMTTVRLLALGPGATIAEHRDYRLGYDDGEVRLHVPIVTHPDVEFVLDGRPVNLAAGECWYLNLNLPHRVDNRSPVRRVHLVIDCLVDEWLRERFLAVLPDRDRSIVEGARSSRRAT